MTLPKMSLMVGTMVAAAALCACNAEVQLEDGDDSSDGDTTSSGVPATSGVTTGTTGQGAGGMGQGGGGQGGGGHGGGGQGGEGGGQSALCAGMAELTLTNAAFVEAGGDGIWSPGEMATVEVTLGNPTPVDNFDYPGVRVETNHAGVESSGNTLFGIFAGDAIPVQLALFADPSVPPGTEVEVTLVVTDLNATCRGLASTTMTLEVE